jgi:hypothetical protein
MMNTNGISERLAGLKEEMTVLKIGNLRYWAKSPHTELEKSAHAFRRDRLLVIKQEFSDMIKRFG